MSVHRRARPIVSRAALALATALAAAPASAADLRAYAGPPVAVEGASCQGPEVQAFPSVWLGHFTGGASAYSGPGGSILLDWRDEKLCFPTRRSCDRWIGGMRRDFHHPEGYYTCLVIR